MGFVLKLSMKARIEDSLDEIKPKGQAEIEV